MSSVRIGDISAIIFMRHFAVFNSLYFVTRYLVKHKKIPNLIHPSSFTEKTLCKMLFDRNKLLPIISDKIAVRDFVSRRVSSKILAEIYGVYESELDIPLNDLPDRFVLKANHGSRFNYFVKSASDKHANIILPIAKKWLTTNFGERAGEWPYKAITPKLHAEEYLEHDDLIECKFFCFDGKPKFIKVYIIRPESGRTSRFFDLNWRTFEVAENQKNFPRDAVPRPSKLLEMTEISSQLSKGFDFLRVDLYYIKGRVVFGELTNWHNSATTAFTPKEYDYKFGAHWDLSSMTYLSDTTTSSFKSLITSVESPISQDHLKLL